MVSFVALPKPGIPERERGQRKERAEKRCNNAKFYPQITQGGVCGLGPGPMPVFGGLLN